MTNEFSFIVWILFVLAGIGGFFVSASFVPYCGDATNLYSNLWPIKLVSVVIIVCMSIVGIVDLFGLSKKAKEAKEGKAFVAVFGTANRILGWIVPVFYRIAFVKT